MYLSLALTLGNIPLLILVLCAVLKKIGVINTIKWKWAGISFVLIIILYFVISSYYKVKYGFPIMINMRSFKIGLIVAGITFVIMFLVVVVSLIFGGAQYRTKKNIVTYILIILAFPLYFLYFLLFPIPLGEKIEYSDAYKLAVAATEEKNNKADFPVKLTKMDHIGCSRPISKILCDSYYSMFFVKNHLDEPKEVQIKIRAFNKENELLKEINSETIKINPGEVKLVTTEETVKEDDFWSQYSFETNQLIEYFEYTYKYRDVK